jgi:hypothetical protein
MRGALRQTFELIGAADYFSRTPEQQRVKKPMFPDAIPEIFGSLSGRMCL